MIELATRRRIGEIDEEFVAIYGKPGLVFILAGCSARALTGSSA